MNQLALCLVLAPVGGRWSRYSVLPRHAVARGILIDWTCRVAVGIRGSLVIVAAIDLIKACRGGGAHPGNRPPGSGVTLPTHPIYRPDKPTPPGTSPGAGLWVWPMFRAKVFNGRR